MRRHRWLSPWNDVCQTNVEISYWWRVTTQIWVVLLIGWHKFPTSQKHYPILGSDTSSVWNFYVRFLAFISRGNHDGAAKCRLVSQALTFQGEPNQTKLTLFREDGWHLTVTQKPVSSENSLRGRFSEGKVKGTSDARETQSTCEEGGNLSPLLPRARIPFPFPFERLLLRLSRKENPKQTQPTYSVHTGTRNRWQASATPTTVPRWLLPLSKLTNLKFRSCSFLRVSLSLAISSTFLWRNPNKKKNIFVLAATRLKLFKTTRNKSFCLLADLFFLFRARVRKWKPRRVY